MADPHPLGPVPGDNEILRVPIFWARAKYDFAVDGGAVGAIDLLPDDALPNGAVLLGAFINVTTGVTGGAGATIALHANSAADINDADDVGGAPWSTTGWKAADFSLGSAPVQLTADRNIVATIAVDTITAGVFEVLVAYLPPGL